MKRKGELLGSVLEAIGQTPLVELSRMTRGMEGESWLSWNT
jgi:hypothetical protein